MRYNRVRYFVVALVLLVQGVCDWGSAATWVYQIPARLMTPVEALQIARTSEIKTKNSKADEPHACACLNCSGGTTCCCLGAEAEEETICFRAVCDTPQDALNPQNVSPKILPTCINSTFLFCAEIVPFCPSETRFWRGRTPSPNTPPPLTVFPA
jgi:hypothetical protein